MRDAWRWVAIGVAALLVGALVWWLTKSLVAAGGGGGVIAWLLGGARRTEPVPDDERSEIAAVLDDGLEAAEAQAEAGRQKALDAATASLKDKATAIEEKVNAIADHDDAPWGGPRD